MGEQRVQTVGGEGGQHVQVSMREEYDLSGDSMGEKHDLNVDSMGEQSDVKKKHGMCETDAKPEVDMSVAELSPVCTVAQSKAMPIGVANLLPTPGQSVMNSQASVPVDTCTVEYKCTQPGQDEEVITERSATTSEASQTDNSVEEKVSFGYRTKFKSFYSIDGVSKGKFTLKKAKGGQLSSKSSENNSHNYADNQEHLKTGNRVN